MLVKFTAFFTLLSACEPIHACLSYAAFSPQLVQARVNMRACRHKSKKMPTFLTKTIEGSSFLKSGRSSHPNSARIQPYLSSERSD